LRFGVIYAASVISYENATDGMLTMDELITYSKHIDVNLLKKFSLN